jgi:hypothetical protein
MHIFYMAAVLFLVTSCRGRNSSKPLSNVTPETGDSTHHLPSGSRVPEIVFDSTNHLLSPGSDTEEMNRKWVSFQARFKFSDFPEPLYTGPVVPPDISKVPADLPDRIRFNLIERMKNEPVNFAGHYTIIHLDCGAMCEDIYIIDRKTGKLFGIFFNDAHEGRWGYKYEPRSRLLIANSEMMDDSLKGYPSVWNLKPELYVWTRNKLKRIQ